MLSQLSQEEFASIADELLADNKTTNDSKKIIIEVDSKSFLKCDIVGCNIGLKSNGVIK